MEDTWEDIEHGVKILRLIGEGGFGKVFICQYKNDEYVVKKVAITQDSDYTIKTLKNELMVLVKMKHPRIVELVHHYVTSKDWNFVLEYCRNGSLRNILEKYQANSWKFDQSDLLAHFMDIVSGLRFLHSVQIIHRDLKPENVLVGRNNRLKLADFGLAKIVPNFPEKHTAVGTITYMAPEVLLRHPYDKSVDIWALGIVFYEMAMLKYPFSASERYYIRHPSTEFTPPVIDHSRRNYSPSVQDLLVLMLQVDPKKRCTLDAFCEQPLVNSIFKQLVKEEEHVLKPELKPEPKPEHKSDHQWQCILA